MKSKRRISRKSPSYYLPLPYAMAVRKTATDDFFEKSLFEGMRLEFVLEGLVHQTISIVAHVGGEDHVIGYVPKGMISRIEGLMEHDESIVLTLEKKACQRLKRMFWVCIDELPQLEELGIH